MEFLISLLTVPGALLAGWLLSGPAAPADDSEAFAALEIGLGALFWVCSYAALRLGWHALPGLQRWATRHRLPARARSAWHAIGWAQAATLAWGGAWRAQAAHLALYAAMPLAWEVMRTLLLVLVLPISIMGFGDRSGRGDGTLDHLPHPSCWTFVTLCTHLHSTHFNVQTLRVPPCAPGADCPTVQTRNAVTATWAAKLLWLLLAAGWITAWRSGSRRVATRT